MKAPKNTKKKAQSTGLGMPGVDVAQLESLLDFMAAHGLEEFEYEHEGLHIRLKKASTGSQAAPAYPAAPRASAPVAPAAASTGAAPDPGPAAPETAAPAAEELHIIKSPIVGTFYQSPSPDAGPYVRPGDNIRSGQVVCIVEAMKLMNEIEADIAGEVVRVLVEDKQPVEYGQALFSIRPDKKKK